MAAPAEHPSSIAMSHEHDKDPAMAAAAAEESPPSFEKGPRFWAIIFTLCTIGLLSSLENTVVATSLPFIVDELDMGEDYVWITNVFFLTAYVTPLPLSPR